MAIFFFIIKKNPGLFSRDSIIVIFFYLSAHDKDIPAITKVKAKIIVVIKSGM